MLIYIFTLAKVHCIHDAVSHYWGLEEQALSLLSPESLANVCVYWRNLLHNTPTLWTHIDLSIDQPWDSNFAFHAQRSLDRANQLPLYVHIEGNEWSSDSQAAVDLLAPYANRIVSLDLPSNALTAHSILLGLFSAPYCGSVQYLSLCDGDSEESDETRGGASLFSTGSLDAFLISLRSLNLVYFSLDYDSPAFQGLTELAVFSSPYLEPTPSQLTQVLTACPALRSLALVGMSLTAGDLPVNAANLPDLQTLDLRRTSFGDVVTITSCILPRRGLSMSFSLNMNESGRNKHDLSPLLSFFKRFHVARLFMQTSGFEKLELDVLFCSLGNSLPSLRELALDGGTLAHGLVEGCLLTDRFPQLHTLHILGGSIMVCRLKTMLAFSYVQAVQLRWYRRYPPEVLQAISEVVPSVFCSIGDTQMYDKLFSWELPSFPYYSNGVL
ncbi:hypothetical protein BDV93DRAFT_8808 [Ceratobasidium sp. AG-I]|nr:hypothetical protein BDV93DRAFT_8808 [Ceratobasidium sp. AG-I]